MINSRFSSLVYKIIGKPEVVHDEYSAILNNALEEVDLFTDPSNLAELEIGHEILNRIENSDDAIKALSALLDYGRFKIIILNEELRPIYNNNNATKLLNQLRSINDDRKLNAGLVNSIKASLHCSEKTPTITMKSWYCWIISMKANSRFILKLLQTAAIIMTTKGLIFNYCWYSMNQSETR